MADRQSSPRNSLPSPARKERRHRSSAMTRISVAQAMVFNAHLVSRDSESLGEINADQALSSTRNFGAEVRKLLNPQAGGQRASNSPATEPLDLPSISSLYSPQSASSSLPELLPSEVEARQCLEAFIFYLGQTQHFIDSRVFSDTLDRLYNSATTMTDSQDVGMIEILLVLAIGRQILRKTSPQEFWPGDKLFKVAIARLPNFTELRTKGIIMVNILALAAVYLQNLDLTEDAYYYSSTALRIAICYQMHRANSLNSMLTSERAHLNRLWWTVYMLERRLAAATGNPVGIPDDAIDLPPPFDAAGFIPSTAIRINLNAAKISGQILSTIYLSKPGSQEAFVNSVRCIMESLYKITNDIPPEHSLNFSATLLKVSRTSASLHLMLYQAMMHAIRPILLYLAKERNNDQIENLSPNSSLHKLARTCVVAGQRCLLIAMAMQRQNTLGVFGFFDLDAIFSAAFTMVLWKMAGSGEDDITTPAITNACRLLEYMEREGSKTAGGRRRDLVRMTERPTNLSRRSQENDNGGEAEISSGQPPNSKSDQWASAARPVADTQTPQDGSAGNAWWQDNQLSQPLWGEMDPFAASNEILRNGDFNDAHELYATYHDQGLRWSGVDIHDWGELERHVAEFQSMPQFNSGE
ncbi:hypothetical protein FOXYS1_5751 [Fusarium oxysporum]|uniref:Xylanolytic transcriptional activator regulatory domain-containing protein n=1 Tax=Fusarium oxysporum TaxID=5507 RepID=A0A8H5ADT7_FUSOX|nr:hypothetical protein FOXYS1_5751 [Fusarium oxysporum]